nr:hypothetical protein [Hyphomicrobium sulfonivorans]
MDHILKRMLVENGDESIERVVNDAVQIGLADFLTLAAHTFNGAHNLANADLDRRARQLHAAMATAGGDQKTGLRQQMHDFERILLGDVQTAGNVGHLDEMTFCLGAINQNADGVARGFVDSHALYSLVPVE